MNSLLSRAEIDAHLFADETSLVQSLADQAQLPAEQSAKIMEISTSLVQAVRTNRRAQGSIDAFMQQYSLSSEEGVVLMCLAEALLRIPDAETADKLIADKIGGRNWQAHLGQSESMFVNASAWGLLLTGKMVTLGHGISQDAFGFLKRFVRKSGEPILRGAMKQAMRIMGRQFVLGQTISEAINLARVQEEQGYRYSYDMLGESALTEKDAARYFKSYEQALIRIGAAARSNNIFENPSLSIKLSALHPRYDEKNAEECVAQLFQLLLKLASQAKAMNIGLTIDAEEVARLDLSLQIFAKLAQHESLKNWNGLGLAVQAYGRRAKPVLVWLATLAKATSRKLPVRLVKGAYWDTEIKRAQEAGYEDYPVFTRKASTDVSYLACARFLLQNRDVFYPQFATHNAQTIAAVLVMAKADKNFEFQRLHGMGQALYDQVVAADKFNQPCRIYAPVGSHQDLLAYLVRRLLENGANTSFVNRLADDEAPLATIIADPVMAVKALTHIPHPRIVAPRHLFAGRINSKAATLWRSSERQALEAEIATHAKTPIHATALINGKAGQGKTPFKIYAPHNNSIVVGHVIEATKADIEKAVQSAHEAQPTWNLRGGAARAAILQQAANLCEEHSSKLIYLLVQEAGKTLDNAQSDLREAVDFLRYYAMLAAQEFSTPTILAGPTGERNELSLHGRGVFACISPWNFPLAIFMGQVAAALAAGNAVVAKPAEQTPLVAFEAVRLLHKAGVPENVVQFLPGQGAKLGNIILAHPALAGVAFTGSNETASIINQNLAKRSGALVTFIAETGGMNAMIVDSSALPEQAVKDVVASAFDSAGQRCSAARILFVQEDVAPKIIDMLKGAMQQLVIGNPMIYKTDIGPVIDAEAKQKLEAHKAKMAASAKTILNLPLPELAQNGHFVAPSAYELTSIDVLETEVFGPILHIVRFASSELNDVCDIINAKNFGLTLGLHTRIESVVNEVRARMKVGNLYVNRNQIGAVVGAQPFGGEGKSGTGPKAGGPNYLKRFAVERVFSVDITASGGNAALLSLEPEI
jgi:RHH-type transcriptional regulator, proline utilization regulon repressor / proline dehydrogenase / delta 1-pyrroline-5-carboxylate dehydrogenase